MRKPEVGDVVLHNYGAVDLVGLVNKVVPANNDTWVVRCVVPVPSGSASEDRSGVLYETREEALEHQTTPYTHTFWVKPDPHKKLLEDIADAIFVFNQSQL